MTVSEIKQIVREMDLCENEESLTFKSGVILIYLMRSDNKASHWIIKWIAYWTGYSKKEVTAILTNLVDNEIIDTIEPELLATELEMSKQFRILFSGQAKTSRCSKFLTSNLQWRYRVDISVDGDGFYNGTNTEDAVKAYNEL